MQVRDNLGSTTYDGLNLAIEKRYSHNFSGRVSYSIGKARGNVNGGLPDTANFQFLDDLNLDLNEGPSGSDRTHNFVLSFRGMVPSTGGLTVSGVYRALSGQPLTIQDHQLRSRPQRHPLRSAAGRNLQRRRRQRDHR